MPNTLKDHGLLIEAMTRARKTVVCVTNPGSSFNELFENAVSPNDATRCDHVGNESRCPFLGPTMILKMDKVRELHFSTTLVH